MSSVEDRLRAAGLKLAQHLPKPGGLYSPTVRTGTLLFVSGHVPLREDGSVICGLVGTEMDVEDARAAARTTALLLLRTVDVAVGLDNVERAVKVLGLVRAQPEFTLHPKVIDGFTEVLRIAFGENGLPARSAIGSGGLPAGACLEVEAIFEVKA